jgi:S-adenosylmethionine hydrolase
MKNPVISLLTDFGSADHYVGAIKGVILGICPKVRLVDISHEVTRYGIAEAGYTLAQAWRCFPAGTIHLVVVDPGVGSARRPVLAEADGHRFVAPDNGVLTMAFAGVAPGASRPQVREITASRYFRQPVSQTFHGRDIFAPVAAHLAGGVRPAQFGKLIADYIRLDAASPVRVSAHEWTAEILKIDGFGNIITSLDWAKWQGIVRGPFEVTVGAGKVARLASSYAEAVGDDPFLICGSAGFVEISVNQGNAAHVLGAKAGSLVTLRLL